MFDGAGGHQRLQFSHGESDELVVESRSFVAAPREQHAHEDDEIATAEVPHAPPFHVRPTRQVGGADRRRERIPALEKINGVVIDVAHAAGGG